jgi:hypothetical protein
VVIGGVPRDGKQVWSVDDPNAVGRDCPNPVNLLVLEG